jgi:hypothetical protein
MTAPVRAGVSRRVVLSAVLGAAASPPMLGRAQAQDKGDPVVRRGLAARLRPGG